MSSAPFAAKSNCHFGCDFVLLVGSERFHLCKEVLSQLSEYFEKLLVGDFQEKERKEVEIKDETSEDMRCFLEATVPHPNIRLINDSNLQTLMRLSDKFQAPSLRQQCSGYIHNCRHRYSPLKSLEILEWMQTYNFDEESSKSLMPAVACLSLNTLDTNRNTISCSTYATIVSIKLRGVYLKAQQSFNELSAERQSKTQNAASQLLFGQTRIRQEPEAAFSYNCSCQQNNRKLSAVCDECDCAHARLSYEQMLVGNKHEHCAELLAFLARFTCLYVNFLSVRATLLVFCTRVPPSMPKHQSIESMAQNSPGAAASASYEELNKLHFTVRKTEEPRVRSGSGSIETGSTRTAVGASDSDLSNSSEHSSSYTGTTSSGTRSDLTESQWQTRKRKRNLLYAAIIIGIFLVTSALAVVIIGAATKWRFK